MNNLSIEVFLPILDDIDNTSEIVDIRDQSSMKENYFVISKQNMHILVMFFYFGLYPVTLVAGLIGNSLTLLVMCKENPKSSTTCLLIALAIADTLCLLNATFTVTVSTLRRFNPAVGNKLLFESAPYFGYYFSSIPFLISTFLTAVIALERSYAVFRPMKVRTVWSRKVIVIICITIFVIFPILRIPSALRFTSENIHNNETNTITFGVRLTEIGKSETLKYIVFVMDPKFFTALAVSVVLVCNFAIIIGMTRNSRKRSRLMSQKSREFSAAQEIRLTKTLLTVTFTFLFCHLPGTIYMAHYLITQRNLDLAKIPNNGYRLAMIVLFYFMILNSALNFFLYTMASLNYRKAIKKIFCQKKQQSSKTFMVEQAV